MAMMFGQVGRIFFQAAAILLFFTIPASADEPKTPPKLKFGYMQRMRIESYDNATKLDKRAQDGTSYFRNRTCLMFQANPQPLWELTLRLRNEWRYYLVPESKGFTLDEIFIDQLYAKVDSIAQQPVTVTVGRQTLSFGEGFVVMDGSPLDGSRSMYFNAIRFDWVARPNHTITGFYVTQPKQDQYLPIIHEQDKPLAEQSEEAAALHYAGTISKAKLQGYFIWKHIKQDRERESSAFINCPGIRAKVPLYSRFTATAELAGQWGRFNRANHRAFGGYVYADYLTGWPIHFPKSFTIGAMYLSGDDPKTNKHEGWEPMFGRWPKWSESYIFTLKTERAVAYWSNLASIFVKTSIAIIPEVTFSLDYYYLLAPKVSDNGPTYPGGRGHERGDLFIGKLAYEMNKNLSGHLLWESFDPGNFYFDGADSYTWVRMEMMLKF